jgi:hypothetical protein
MVEATNFRFVFGPKISRIQSKGTAVKAQASLQVALISFAGLIFFRALGQTFL